MTAEIFVAIDVETANADRESICQIGIVIMEGDREALARSFLVDPGCDFDPMNTSIHGLDERDVAGAPVFEDVHGALAELLDGLILVSHSPFDRQALAAACEATGREPFNVRWLDSLRVARATWPDLENHRLPTVAAAIGHDLRHHDALEDARAAAQLIRAAQRITGHRLDAWADGAVFKAQQAARQKQTLAKQRIAGSGSGPLAGHCVVLTGDFTRPKAEIAAIVGEHGASVSTTVSKRVTIVVVGGRDIERYDGRVKSAKHVKAEALIADGHALEILSEADLLARL